MAAEEDSDKLPRPTAQQEEAWVTAYELKPRVCDLEDVVCAGLLLKKTTILGRWVPRWFVLPANSDFLYYYTDDKEGTPLKGIICLAGATIAWEGPLGKYEHMFTIGVDLPRRPSSSEATSSFALRAQGNAQFNSWHTALRGSPARSIYFGDYDKWAS